MTELDIMQYLPVRPKKYVDRHVGKLIERRFNGVECIVLLGPRQIGKSTLARTHFVEKKGAVYRDLEDESVKNEIGNGLNFFKKYKDRIVILDEIQENPVLFRSVKVHIDQQRFEENRESKFLLLGSVSLEQQRGSAKSLTGRSMDIQMTGILLNEILDVLPDSFTSPSETAELKSKLSNSLYNQLNNLLLIRGGMPDSLFAADSEESQLILTRMVNTYVQNDLRSFGLNVDANKFFDCLNLIAKTNGLQYELGRFARKLEFNREEVQESISALEQLLLIRKLHPLNGFGKLKVKLSKQPKLYIRDSGILSSRLGINDLTSLTKSGRIGEVWEGFVVETIISAAINAGIYKDCRYFRTYQGHLELDLVLELSKGGLWGIEIKRSAFSQPSQGTIEAAQMIEVDRRIVVHAGNEKVELNGGFKGLPLIEVLNEIKRLGESRVKKTSMA